MKVRFRNIFSNPRNETENDVTKAFINLLEHARNVDLTSRFIRKFLDSSFKNSKFKYELFSRSKSGLTGKENKFHIFINSQWNTDYVKKTGVDRRDGSIPDALVYSPGKILMVFEAKVSAPADKDQIEKQCNHYQISSKDQHALTWQEVGKFLREVQREVAAEQGQYEDRFLINQFLTYLEAIDMSSFSGIDFVDEGGFSYDAEKAKNILRSLMDSIQNEIDPGKIRFETYRKHQGNWNAFCYKNRPGEEVAHYSVYVFPEFCGIDCLMKKTFVKKILRREDDRRRFKKVLLDFADQFKGNDKEHCWFLEFSSYCLKDWRPGVQRGPEYSPLVFRINLLHLDEVVLSQVMDLMLSKECLGKGTRIEKWKDMKLVKRIHYDDKKYPFNDPQKVVKDFCASLRMLEHSFYTKVKDIASEK